MKQVNCTPWPGIRDPKAGFTLVEILIVVVLLGILAAIAVPQFSTAAEDTRKNTIKMSLFRIRSQLEIYRGQHDGRLPTLANFADQMKMFSDSQGNTSLVHDATFRWGPYLMEIPKNPRVLTNTIADTAIGTSAWYYDENTGEFHANDSAESRAY